MTEAYIVATARSPSKRRWPVSSSRSSSRGEVPTWLSLTFIVVAMAVATIASIIKMKRDGKSFRDQGPQESEASQGTEK